jgi:hypothetical protein
MVHRLAYLTFAGALLVATLAAAAGPSAPITAAKPAAEPTPVQLFLVDPGVDREAGLRTFEGLLSLQQRTLAAGPTCTFVSNFCSSCAGGKVRSCDRYRCGSPNPVTVDQCTSCANFC